MNDDAALLRRYAEEGSEAAFSELVHRRLDLVYGAALRRTGGDRHRAADVAQQVFTTLARDAAKLARHGVLSAWLHTATRNAALNLMISEQRRKAREREAAALEPVATPAAVTPEWDRLRPVLDAAIDELAEPDRAAIVLRFLERRPFAQIGAALRVTEDAARMRTERALEKLRLALARRGITSTAAALAAIVAGQPLASAPAGLAAALASNAFAAGASTGLLALVSSLMLKKTLATVLVTGAAAFAAGGYLGIEHASHQPLPRAPELPQHSHTIAGLRQQIATLRADRDALSAANSKLAAEAREARAARPTPPVAPRTPELAEKPVVQRAVLNNLRQLAAARDQFQLEHGRPATSLDELVGETKYIRRLVPVAGENYFGVSLLRGQTMIVTTAAGDVVTYAPQESAAQRARAEAPAVQSPAAQRAHELAQKVGPAINKAMAAYQAANGGARPQQPEALLPYFATPQEGADFVEALEAQKEARRKN